MRAALAYPFSLQPCDPMHDVMTAAFSGRKTPANFFLRVCSSAHSVKTAERGLPVQESKGCIVHAQKTSSARRRLANMQNIPSTSAVPYPGRRSRSTAYPPPSLNPWTPSPIESELLCFSYPTEILPIPHPYMRRELSREAWRKLQDSHGRSSASLTHSHHLTQATQPSMPPTSLVASGDDKELSFASPHFRKSRLRHYDTRFAFSSSYLHDE